MRRLVPDLLAALTVPLLTVAVIRAEDPGGIREQVSRQIDQLGSPNLQERAAAEAALIKLGPEILPLLPPPESLSRPSVREAVRRVRVALEKIRAFESIRPAQATLRGTMTLQAALVELSRQTGNAIDLRGVEPARLAAEVNLDLEQVPFWQALDLLVRRGDLQFASESDTRTLALAAADPRQPLAAAIAYAGAFRIAVPSAELGPLPGDGASHKLRIRLELRAEPRLRPLFARIAGGDFAATVAGKELEPISPDARLELPLASGARPLATHLDFRSPAADKPEFVSLRGKLTVQTAAAVEEFSFGPLGRTQPVSRRSGGVTVTLEDAQFRRIETGRHDLAVDVTVSYDAGGPAFESHRTWVFHNDAFLVAEGAEPRRPDEFETLQQADGGVRLAYRFRELTGTPDSYRFVYAAPTLLVNVPVEFELKRIGVTPP